MARHVRVTGVNETQEKLRLATTRLFPRRGGPVLQGLRKGATVIRRAWRAEIRRMVATSQYYGSRYEPTGLMARSVKIYRVKRPSKLGANEAIRVTIDPKVTYDDGTRVAAVAGILEHGHSNMEAKAIVRKSFDASESQAIAAITKGIEDNLARVLKKL